MYPLLVRMPTKFDDGSAAVFLYVSKHTAVPFKPLQPRPPPIVPTRVAGVVDGSIAKHAPSAPVPWSIVRSNAAFRPLNA